MEYLFQVLLLVSQQKKHQLQQSKKFPVLVVLVLLKQHLRHRQQHLHRLQHQPLSQQRQHRLHRLLVELELLLVM